MDGHWSVKWVERISVTKASAEWKVQLEGAVPGKLDKPTYVNCASPGCHGSGWVDAAGKRWEGIPLYLVAGLIDDKKRHGAGAYDAAAARRGYDIVIETADGRGRDHRLSRHRRQAGRRPRGQGRTAASYLRSTSRCGSWARA